MSDDVKAQVLEANRRFHDTLGKRNLYMQQPFLNDLNRARVRRIIQRLSQEAGNEAILDVGCGTGFILSIANGYFNNLAGVDISSEMLKQVPIPGIDLQVAQVENLPFPDDRFNVVTMHSVLHHLFEMEAPLREIYRCLKPGGIFYADESPNAYCLRTLHGVDTSDTALSPFLRQAAISVQKDVAAYEDKYKMDPEIVRMAMYRDKVLGGIAEEEVREELRKVGFSAVIYQYRWFLGQGKYFGSGYDENSCHVEEYLRSLLPLTRPLFKYISFTARKG